MKVLHAELQSSVVFHGTEIVGAVTLDTNALKVKGLGMEWKSDGLYITTPKLTSQGVTGFIPAANVKCLRFAMESEPSKDAANKKLKAL